MNLVERANNFLVETEDDPGLVKFADGSVARQGHLFDTGNVFTKEERTIVDMLKMHIAKIIADTGEEGIKDRLRSCIVSLLSDVGEEVLEKMIETILEK